MRRYYGTGYDNGRPSRVGMIALGLASIAVALSVFVVVRKPMVAPRVLGNVITASPTSNPAPTSPPILSPIDPAITPDSEVHEPAPDRHPPQPPVRPKCRNSTNPACGRFYWSPSPGPYAPMRIDVSIFPSNPAAGEEVTYTVTAKDGDARIEGIFPVYGDGANGPTHVDCVTPARYGAWTPPARHADKRTVTFRHVYKKAGTYKASFTAQSECGSPYGDILTLPVDMVVEAASTTSPSPSPEA